MSDGMWQWVSWFAVTYLLHSTVLLGAAWLLTRSGRLRPGLHDAVWKAALTGGVATALLASAGLMRPMWELRVPVSAQAAEAPVSGSTTSQLTDEPGAAVEGTRREDAEAPATVRSESPALPPVVTPAGRGVPGRTLLLAVWAVIASAMMVLWPVRRQRLLSLLGVRTTVRDAAMQVRFDELCARAGVRRARLTESQACPLPMALSGSEVCVPARFVSELDAEQQEGALAHEVAHLRRRDPAWLLATHVLGSVFFFQPLNFVARRKLREAAESMCDDWAARQGRGLGLARCLAEVASWLQPGSARTLSAASPMASSSNGLLQRVERLLREEAARERAPGRWTFAMVVAGVIVAAGLAPSVTAATRASVELPIMSQLPGAQQAVFRAPDGSAPLEQKLAWAAEQARSRGSRGYWVAYAVRRRIEPRQWYLSDSEGMSIDGFGTTDHPIAEQLGSDPAFSDGSLVVLLRYDGANRIVRLGHRSLAAPMEWDGRPIFWLGTSPDEQSIPYLVGLLNGPVRDVKLQAELVDAVAIHETTALVLPVLRRVLDTHGSAEVRAEAIEGVEHHPVQESLQLAVQTVGRDASVEVRAEAAEAIGSIPVAGAADALVEMAVRGTDEQVRQEAAEALGELQMEDAMRGIETVIFSATDRAAVTEAVEALGERSGDVLPLLRRVMWEHPAVEARMEAVETLAEVKGVDLLPLLEDVLARHPDQAVQEEALDVLGELGTEAAWSALMHAAEVSPNAATRYEGVQALAEYAVQRGQEAERQAARQLERMVFRDAAHEVRMEAVDALRELRPSIARPILRRIADTHPDASLREEARDGLGGMN